MLPLALFVLFAQEPATSRPAPAPPAAGEEAPDFALPDQTGKELRLSSLRARGKTLLAFYPKDDTPG